MRKTITGTASQIIVCVDLSESHQICGRIYNDFLNQTYSFAGEYEMLMQMQAIYEELGVPQSTFAFKKFVVPQVEQLCEPMPYETVSNGTVATFCVHVLYRQNASWQGNVQWMEGNQKQNFRSVLELLSLMHQVE